MRMGKLGDPEKHGPPFLENPTFLKEQLGDAAILIAPFFEI